MRGTDWLFGSQKIKPFFTKQVSKGVLGKVVLTLLFGWHVLSESSACAIETEMNFRTVCVGWTEI